MPQTSIETLSVIARQCVAVTCLERFCLRYQINHPALSALIEHVWAVTKVEPGTFGPWEQGFASLPISGFESDWPEDICRELPRELLRTLKELVEHVVETSATTWYGNDLPATKRQLEIVLEICKKHGVPAPELQRYTQLHARIHGSWGPPLSNQELATWRALVLND
ncbi:hypothetical protein [Duganella sp. S19_KUP01_CR8]|uniref:hypothetical protein n=1 Tax=Duganella sp. S19_KUP01_CR8 TaxID=3025502 RepID=UPI002FCDBCB7